MNDAASESVRSRPPRRRLRLTLLLDADDRDAMSTALMNIALRVDRGELTTGVSGGCDSGYCYELLEDPSQTHDNYFAELREHIASARSTG